LASFRKIDFFAPDLLASWCLGGSPLGSPALEHRKRAVEGAVGGDLIALDRGKLGPLRLGQDQRARVPEERRLRPRGLPPAPRPVDDDIRKPRLPGIGRRQGVSHLRPEALEGVGLFLRHRVSPRRQPVPECVPA
jgi:hypothetical protein